MIRTASLALLLALTASIAAAAAKPADITGAWGFETKPYGDNCVLSGSMMIAKQNGNLTCTFNAQERCARRTDRARETCVITRTGDTLSIVSTVQSVTPAGAPYVPDNFELKIESSAHMTGTLAYHYPVPADFFRGDAPIS